MKKAICLFMFLFFLSIATNVWAKVIYVKTDGSDSNNGLSWDNAVKRIQVAIDLADSGDQIWVAQGPYEPSTAIEVNKALSLYGGFGGNETDLNQRQ